MATDLQLKVEKLRGNYIQATGRRFEHFFCPILFQDDDVSICKAHIINLGFANSSRSWTVQRKDIDNFYGSIFESDFVGIQYRENPNIGDTITDRKLSKRFAPKFLLDGKPVDFFVVNGDIPENFTGIIFDNNGKIVHLGIKMPAEEMSTAATKNWEIAISKDIRIPAFVSLIKAAHLTLFELLGYNYALSAGGYFVGRQILGEFFLQNRERSKPEIIENAPIFFREFIHMVRPVQFSAINFEGTITDGSLFICTGNSGPWAFIVLIKTSQSLHGVMLPCLNQPDSVIRFLEFLRNSDESLDVVLACFKQDHWEISKKSAKLSWPKSGILFP